MGSSWRVDRDRTRPVAPDHVVDAGPAGRASASPAPDENGRRSASEDVVRWTRGAPGGS